MDTFLAFLAALAFSGCAVVLLVHRWVRAVRRRLVSLRARAQLSARAYGVGPRAEAARLRRDMERAMASTRRALTAAREMNAPVGDVPSLLGRLELSARTVDGELQVLESQPDRTRIQAQLVGPRSRALAVTGSAACLVDGLLHAAGHDADALAALQSACAIEAAALRSAQRSWLPAQS